MPSHVGLIPLDGMNPHTLGKLCVTLQFGLLTALAMLCLKQAAQESPGATTYGLWLASVLVGLWTLSANRIGNFNIRPEPKSDGRLVQHGPYRWVRHPMYLSVLLLAAGAATWLMAAVAWVLWALLLSVLTTKAGLEERWLLQRYPDYADYRQRTWRLLPGVY